MATKCKISLALVVVVGFLHSWLANWASLFAGWMQKVPGELARLAECSMALWLYMCQGLKFDRSCGPTSSAVAAQHHPQWQLKPSWIPQWRQLINWAN